MLFGSGAFPDMLLPAEQGAFQVPQFVPMALSHTYICRWRKEPIVRRQVDSVYTSCAGLFSLASLSRLVPGVVYK